MIGRTGTLGGAPMKRELVLPVLLGLVLLAFGRGIWALGAQSLWWDESLSLHRAQGSLEQVLSNEILLSDGVTSLLTIDNHPPLYFLLLWASVRLFGESEFALRFVSLGFAVLLVPLLYVTGKRLVDERTGIVAAALGALSSMYLWYGREARMYTMLAAVGLLSFYCLIRAVFDHGEPGVSRRRWPWIVAYAVTSVGLVLIHYLSALLIAFELVALAWILLRRPGSRRAMALTIAAVLVGVVPLLVYGWTVQPQLDSVPGFTFVPLWVLLRDLLNSFSLGLWADVGTWYILLIDLLFLLLASVGFAALVLPAAPRRWRAAGWLLAGYMLIPVALVYLSSFSMPVYMTSRHLIFVSPPFSLLMAAGLTRWRARSPGTGVLVGLVVLVGLGLSTVSYFTSTSFVKPDHRAWGKYLREQVRPGDVVVVDPPHIAKLYEYYGANDVPWIGLPLLGSTREQNEAKLQELLAIYDRVWLAVSSTPGWGDPEGLPRKWLDEYAFPFDQKLFHSSQSLLQVVGYQRHWPSAEYLPGDAQPWQIQFTSSLGIKGYRLVTQAESGQDLHVQVFWSVEAPVPEQASVRLSVVDGQGHLWGQVDECPFSGLYPMEQWQAGLLLRDEHRVPLLAGMPPGAYELEMELLHRPDGCAGGSGSARQPMVVPPQARRGNGVLLGTVEVRSPAAPPSIGALDIERRSPADFDGLRLLGSDVPGGDLEMGSRLEVTLYWESRQAVSYDAKIRLQLLDEAGIVQSQVVVRPVGGRYPAHFWEVGQRLQGKFWLPVPLDAPAGQYTVELVPEPPLRKTGFWADVQRTVGFESGIKLGFLDVVATQTERITIAPTMVPPPADLDILHPLVASVGDQVRFLGHDLNSETIRAGEALSFTLYWQALEAMSTSYTVFTHLLDDANQVWGQKDGLPLDGSHPTTEWEPGEVILDPYSFIVSPDAPQGNYLLEIGLYHAESATRLPVLDAEGNPLAQDRIVIAKVKVESPPAEERNEVASPSPEDLRFVQYLPLVLRGAYPR